MNVSVNENCECSWGCSAGTTTQMLTDAGVMPRILELSAAAAPEGPLALVLLGRLSSQGDMLDTMPTPQLAAVLADQLVRRSECVECEQG